MTTSQEVASIIRSQIRPMTLMAIGYHNPACGADEDGNHYLQFKYKAGRNNTYMAIILMPSDTYTVKTTRIVSRRNPYRYEMETLNEVDDVYCDQLDEVVFQMGSTAEKVAIAA